jgi:hypothetical protein
MTHHIVIRAETAQSRNHVETVLLSILAKRDPDGIEFEVLPGNGPKCRDITLEDIAKIKNALHIGRENSEDLLTQHEMSLGRTTRNNRLTAEAMEVDVELILEALAILAQ